jgi:hypothetical protein
MKTTTKNTLTLEYNKVHNLIQKILAPNERRVVFSMYKEIKEMDKDGNNWIIEVPNFNSKEPVYKGTFVFRAKHEGYSGNPVKNPTWKNILIEANNAANGDHVFLEGLQVNKKGKVSYVDMCFGS